MPAAQDDLLSLHTLSLLASTRSFTETARRSGVTTSAVSRRVTELETRHRKKLVKRTTRVVELTTAGLALVAQAKALATGLVDRTPLVTLQVDEDGPEVAVVRVKSRK